MALMFVFTGILAALTSLSGYAFPAIRNVETILPDHGTAEPASRAASLSQEKTEPARG
jgi:hypothetical protein